MSRRPKLIGFAAIAVSVLALSACSAEPEKLDPMKSPLSEYTNAIYQQGDEESYALEAKEMEELIASCMKEEGFEYIPVDQSQYISFEDEGVDRDTEEWVAANGYGMMQTPEQLEEQNEQFEDYVDPNQDYVMALSESEQTAYYEVLYGVQPTDEELNDDGSYEYNWETAGCQGAASHEVQGDQPWDDDKYKDLLESMNTIYEDLQTDPAIKALDVEWASCMADAGYTFKAKQDAMMSISDELNEFYETAYGEDGTGPGPDEASQAEFREKEIEVALADFTCGEKLDYNNKALAVQFELERTFIADNKSELDALVADYEKGN